MQVMLTEILDSSLIEVEQLNLDREPVRLHPIAAEVAQERGGARRNTTLWLTCRRISPSSRRPAVDPAGVPEHPRECRPLLP